MVAKGSSRQGGRVDSESRADFAHFVADETQRWSAIVKAANIHLE